MNPLQRVLASIFTTVRECSRDAFVTWILFLVMQAVALHFMVEGF